MNRWVAAWVSLGSAMLLSSCNGGDAAADRLQSEVATLSAGATSSAVQPKLSEFAASEVLRNAKGNATLCSLMNPKPAKCTASIAMRAICNGLKIADMFAESAVRADLGAAWNPTGVRWELTVTCSDRPGSPIGTVWLYESPERLVAADAGAGTFLGQ